MIWFSGFLFFVFSWVNSAKWLTLCHVVLVELQVENLLLSLAANWDGSKVRCSYLPVIVILNMMAIGNCQKWKGVRPVSPLHCHPSTHSPPRSHVHPLSAAPAEPLSCTFVSFWWFIYCRPAQWWWPHAPCRRLDSLSCSSSDEGCPVCGLERIQSWK